MHFASDNASGASPKVLEAFVAANAGAAMPYGADPFTQGAQQRIDALFGRACATFLVPTGTAANALALATLCPPWGAIFCHHDAHVMDDECGAPEFFSAGAKLVPLAGRQGKIDPASFADALEAYPRGMVKQVQPACVTLSQATESGTLYTLEEIARLCAMAHEKGLAVHMDGARFANALVALDVDAASMSWKAGVDALSFGATKNGTAMCEAVIFFDPARAEDFAYRRKRAGHTVSKGRYLGAQLSAYLDGGHWLDLARTANARARRLADGMAQLPGVRLPWRTQVNEVFPVLPARMDAALRAAGAVYYAWSGARLDEPHGLRRDEVFARMVTNFATTEAEVDRLIAIAADA